MAVHKIANNVPFGTNCHMEAETPWKNPSAWSDKVEWVTKYLDDVFHKRLRAVPQLGECAPVSFARGIVKKK